MKIALITGAASGIGLALTYLILYQGNRVIMVDNDAIKLEKESRHALSLFPGNLLAIPCDVSRADEVTQLAHQVKSKYTRIDWIYNNAGILGPLGPVWDVNPEHIQKVMQVNVQGMIHIIQAFTPFLFQQSFRSHIINMASLYALCTSSQTAAYSISKHAVLALSESLHFDLMQMKKPVDVSVVFPSFTDTALLSADDAAPSFFHNALKSLLSRSRPATDTAKQIVQQVEQKKFYIFPDHEVKGYCDERSKALLLQEKPHVTSIEKLMSKMMARQEAQGLK